MSKKPTTTKEAMLEGAFRLVREKGHAFLTARNLAAFLGCSTQPIMYQFPNLDTLRELTYQKPFTANTSWRVQIFWRWVCTISGLQKKNRSSSAFFFSPVAFRDSAWKT